MHNKINVSLLPYFFQVLLVMLNKCIVFLSKTHLFMVLGLF